MATKKPTPAQLAARERFAAMARSGAFKRKPAAKRAKNPAKPREQRNRTGIVIKRGNWVQGRDIYGQMIEGVIMRVTGRGVDAYVTLTDGRTLAADDVTQTLGPMTVDPSGVVRQNPLTRVKRNSPSMATGEAPSARLKKRRAKTAKAPAGYYANPSPKTRRNTQGNYNGRFDVLAWKRERNSANGNPAFSFTIRSQQYGQTLTGRTKANSQFALMLPDDNPGQLDAKLSVSPTGRVTMIDADVVRRGNPVKRGVPYRNEAKSVAKDDPSWIGYAVHRVNSPGSAYAILGTRADAVAYAQQLADRKGKQMGVTRIKYNVQQGVK